MNITAIKKYLFQIELLPIISFYFLLKYIIFYVLLMPGQLSPTCTIISFWRFKPTQLIAASILSVQLPLMGSPLFLHWVILGSSHHLHEHFENLKITMTQLQFANNYGFADIWCIFPKRIFSWICIVRHLTTLLSLFFGLNFSGESASPTTNMHNIFVTVAL